ncbi:MAG TPA: glycerol-3-phosphate dehydrogenase/oxidase [Actinobacteria bacterium]|nr:glycerol-3-phosphate dehydrogenase/oxidase [Actinomycetota bacterium]
MSLSASWTPGWRDRVWSLLDGEWDVVVVGGGITGAAILHAAAQRGWRALLVEQRDFAWGASSRSSKMVHGGLRYVAQGKLGLTHACARERKRLLDEYPDLIEPLGFVLPTYTGTAPAPWLYRVGLSIYDLLAGQWTHESRSAQEMGLLIPNLRQADLSGGFRFEEAVTDDARLVFELIRDAVAQGAHAINYVNAEELLRPQGRVVGLKVRDTESGTVTDVTARFVINATGAWADRLREQVGGEPRIRPLRGSHLVFPGWRVPLAQAVSKPHPWDGRPVFALPWEGATIVGTTDHDHESSLSAEPSISDRETAYLMALVHDLFPSLGIGHTDVLSTFAGVRPVIASGKADPSKESRDHVIWEEDGLVTVTGGKLTTFRLIARDTLAKIEAISDGGLSGAPSQSSRRRRRQQQSARRHAPDSTVATARDGELEPIADTPWLWAELRRAAGNEAVMHLDDLLLRRVRVGLLLEGGGVEILPRVKEICAEELGWDDARWDVEMSTYLETWDRAYRPPAPEA